jgi:TIR domain
LQRSTSKGLFISYRRGEAAGQARALSAVLGSEFGKQRIFMDVDSISPGSDFVEAIDQAINSCGVVLALIGHDWARRGGDEKLLLDNPDDFVRRELSSALEQNVPIIPILVERASMPPSAELPEALRALSRHNALELENARWDSDVEKLIRAIKTLMGQRAAESPEAPASWWKKPRVLGSAVGAVVLVLVAVVLALSSGGSSSASGVSASSWTVKASSEPLATALLTSPFASSELPSQLSQPSIQLDSFLEPGLVANVQLRFPGPDNTDVGHFYVFANAADASNYFTSFDVLNGYAQTGVFSDTKISDTTRCSTQQTTGTASSSSFGASECEMLSGDVVSTATSFQRSSRAGDKSVTLALASQMIRHLERTAQSVSLAPRSVRQLSPNKLASALATASFSSAEDPYNFQSASPAVSPFVGQKPAGFLERVRLTFTYTGTGTYAFTPVVDYYVFNSAAAAKIWYGSGLFLTDGRRTATISSTGFSEPTNCDAYTDTAVRPAAGQSACDTLSGNTVVQGFTSTTSQPDNGDNPLTVTLARAGLIHLMRLAHASS